MTTSLRCGECGNKNVKLTNVKGRLFPYLSFPRLKLQKDIELNVCQNCQNIIMVKGDAARLDMALADTVIAQSRNYIETLLGKMGCTQSQMADSIGFTPEYLSGIKNGKKIPEFRTFNYFKILSNYPGALELVLEHETEFLKTKTYKQHDHQLQVLDIPAAGNDYAMAA